MFEEEIAMSAQEEDTTMPNKVYSVRLKKSYSYVVAAAAKLDLLLTQP